jgi:hypothetical protein
MRSGRRVAVAVMVVLAGGLAAPAAAAARADPSWVIQATPNPAGATYILLSGVSCASAAACTAVGYYDNGSGVYVTLAEAWNGSRWKIQSTPNPAGGGILYGVSCTSATACTATGGYENSSGAQVTLAERWNGTKWKIQSTPNPARGGILYGVSCTSATACTAAGGYVNSSEVAVTLAEAWNGSRWEIQATPVPAGAKHSYLSGVSCTPAGCTAVGNHEDSSGVEVTLAERRS